MKPLSKIQATALQLRLNHCCAKVPEIQLILLATVDGFQQVVAGSQRADTELPEKFAAIASSMMALGEAAGKEVGSKKRLEAVVLDLTDLRVILRMVDGGKQQFVLATVADRKASLSVLLKIVYENARLLEEALR
ncbi:MAG: roadblock/LC7 domain-containing protein [Burkholderiales bacterium]|jgi:predicted regulator of Ras-like GTPase activity (Roadblock/LC7/MglB family)|nr:roadblock/LC7 domain-containing protein [Burkholderiales bacterium]